MVPPPAPTHRRPALAGALALGLAPIAVLAGEVLLPVIPLLALVASLLLGRYPGADALDRLARRLGRPRCCAAADQLRPRRPRLAHFPRGGLLLAHSLSGRAPPR
ncbi:MAG: hypothetical protein ACXWZH_10405 [Solirubrobacterales bacterium]